MDSPLELNLNEIYFIRSLLEDYYQQCKHPVAESILQKWPTKESIVDQIS